LLRVQVSSLPLVLAAGPILQASVAFDRPAWEPPPDGWSTLDDDPHTCISRGSAGEGQGHSLGRVRSGRSCRRRLVGNRYSQRLSGARYGPRCSAAVRVRSEITCVVTGCPATAFSLRVERPVAECCGMGHYCAPWTGVVGQLACRRVLLAILDSGLKLDDGQGLACHGPSGPVNLLMMSLACPVYLRSHFVDTWRAR
jgi:hypothetical protein